MPNNLPSSFKKSVIEWLYGEGMDLLDMPDEMYMRLYRVKYHRDEIQRVQMEVSTGQRKPGKAVAKIIRQHLEQMETETLETIRMFRTDPLVTVFAEYLEDKALPCIRASIEDYVEYAASDRLA